MFWIIIIIALVLFVIVGRNGANKQKENNAKLVELGYSLESKIETGKYVAGHPDINDSISKTSIFPRGNKLEIMLEKPLELPTKMGEIETRFIRNILAEDQSTVEKRVTAGRLLMTGIFAFAWKKKKKMN